MFINYIFLILNLIIIINGLIIPCSRYSDSCQKYNCCKPLICYENTACIHNNITIN